MAVSDPTRADASLAERRLLSIRPGRAHGLHDRLQRLELTGRLLVCWFGAFVAFRWSSGPADAAAAATLLAPAWGLLHSRVAQSFRAMTFVAGPFLVAAITSAFAVAGLAALAYLEPWWEPGRETLLLLGGANLAAVTAWGLFVTRATSAPARLLVVGGDAAVVRLLANIDSGNVPLDVVAVVADEIDPAIEARPVFTAALDELGDVVRRIEPDLVVIAVQRGRPVVFRELLHVAETGFRITGLPELYEFTFGRLPIEELTPAWFMSVLHAYNRPANRLAKRAFDLVVALVGVAVSLPLLPAIVLVVKRTPGPLLYRQTRLGEHGRPFTMLKFRSMRSDAEAGTGARWAARADDRIIPGGRLLRLLRLDELPQLVNVLRGEMSIVGPRPERPEFLAYLEGEVPFWSQRHLLRPGITGWAQIRSSYAADTLATVEKLSYDLWYLRHRSLLLDILVCARTLPRMVTFGGAR
ncbi:MAG TPA: exopolysaccharide biosynthesis polyprenyl glycosylphosphotransferase [Gaiellaceae bacterium]|nr:exopolysaccharide biosynthesis polyprenyl glycosylphosphotransferase [Gaiellaceae bacterium]